jgi:MFS family permease
MAPLLGGWLAGVAGYPAMFALAALLSLFGFSLLGFTMREPRRLHPVTAAHD